jgi:hypothetical protein
VNVGVRVRAHILRGFRQQSIREQQRASESIGREKREATLQPRKARAVSDSYDGGGGGDCDCDGDDDDDDDGYDDNGDDHDDGDDDDNNHKNDDAHDNDDGDGNNNGDIDGSITCARTLLCASVAGSGDDGDDDIDYGNLTTIMNTYRQTDIHAYIHTYTHTTIHTYIHTYIRVPVQEQDSVRVLRVVVEAVLRTELEVLYETACMCVAQCCPVVGVFQGEV